MELRQAPTKPGQRRKALPRLLYLPSRLRSGSDSVLLSLPDDVVPLAPLLPMLDAVLPPDRLASAWRTEREKRPQE